MFSKMLVLVACLLAAAAAYPAETVLPPQDQVTRFAAKPTELFLPLIFNKGENATLLALTYEYCAGVRKGLAGSIVREFGMLEDMRAVARALTAAFSEEGFTEVAVFYAKCSFE